MSLYDIKIKATEENARLGTLYRIVITNLLVGLSREIRVKHSTLAELHD